MRDLQAAAFLACSWFWCIGGFFPVLLHQEFGGVSFPFFLAFNVAGAALFGFAWTNSARLRFLDRFGEYARWFSALVAGYHLVFITWISILLQNALPLIGFVAVTAAFVLSRRRLYVLAGGVLAASAGLFAFILTAAPTAAEAQAETPFIHQILPLAFGFLLAPYFDLTFHRAFARAARPRLAFLIGFGGMFTLLLCGVYFGMPAFQGLTSAGGLAQPAVAAVAALLVLQTGFTTAAHLGELDVLNRWATRPAVLAFLAAACLCLAHLGLNAALPDLTRAGGELIYRNFVFLVGVVFPVFLLFQGLNRRSLMVLAFVSPCYALGFLISGPFAPFLSVAMAALALFFWRSRRSAPSPQAGTMEEAL